MRIITSISICTISLLVFLSSCSQKEYSYISKASQKAYKKAVKDASKPTDKKISNNLLSINKDNAKIRFKEIDGKTHVLAVAWTKHEHIGSYRKKEHKLGNYNIWVTIVPELKSICDEIKKSEAPKLRVKQLLGLPPQSTHTYFVEMWVKPEDLFRPCPDGEISDNECSLNFPEDVSEEHRKWIENNRQESQYPWSQLGYTYDWARHTDKVGLSEFVIKNKSTVIVEKIYFTDEYCL